MPSLRVRSIFLLRSKRGSSFTPEPGNSHSEVTIRRSARGPETWVIGPIFCRFIGELQELDPCVKVVGTTSVEEWISLPCGTASGAPSALASAQELDREVGIFLCAGRPSTPNSQFPATPGMYTIIYTAFPLMLSSTNRASDTITCRDRWDCPTS